MSFLTSREIERLIRRITVEVIDEGRVTALVVRSSWIMLAGRSRRLRRFGPTHIDGRSVERVLDVGGVESLDHLDTGAAVFRNLINVGSFHEPHTDVGVSKAVGRTSVAIAISFQVGAIEYTVKQLDVIAGKHEVGSRRKFHVDWLVGYAEFGAA